ncbi:MAG: methyl-accepting chemotaxis protein [Spirochaetes bacterium]|nr:methyl-accepting chemotaxis protein [Spirochaetota bacterium]
MSRPRSSIFKYMISFTVSVILLTAAFTFILLSFQSKKNAYIRDYLNRLSETASIETADKYYSISLMMNFKNYEEIKNYFHTVNDSRLLSVIIFSQTEDENFFKVREIVNIDKAFKTPYSQGKSINLSTGKNYIKNGLYEVTADPRIYKENNFFWQNVFFPVREQNKTYVVQLYCNTSFLENPITAITSEDLYYRKYIFISVSIFLVVTVLISLLYMHNLTLFINSLAHVVKKAARGEPGFKLNTAADDDFKELAYSFNNLMSEMKEKDRKINELSEKDYLDDIFKTGVQMLKENRLDEAESVFNTLSYIKPDGFGSYFNLGVINAKRKKYGVSLEMFEKARQANPDHDLTNSYIMKVKYRISNNG